MSASNATSIDFALDHLTRYEQTDPHIYYTGAWTVYTSTAVLRRQLQLLHRHRRRGHHLLQRHRLDSIAMKGTTTGKADVYVDNVKTDTVDLAATAATYKVKVFTTGTCPAGRTR